MSEFCDKCGMRNDDYFLCHDEACPEKTPSVVERLRKALRDLVDLDQRCGWHSKQQDAAEAILAETAPEARKIIEGAKR